MRISPGWGHGNCSRQACAWVCPLRFFQAVVSRRRELPRTHCPLTLSENAGTFFSGTLPCELRPSWPGRPPTLSPQLRDLQSQHSFALLVPWPGNSLGCELRRKLHLVSLLSGLTVPCCLMSNVLKVLVLFLQSAFLVASGGRVHLVPVTVS